MDTEELRSLLEKATPRPWRHGDGKSSGTCDLFAGPKNDPIPVGGTTPYHDEGSADAALIVSAVNSLDALLEVKARAEAVLEKLKACEEAAEPIYASAWVHGVKYEGPTYKDEVAALRTALERAGTSSAGGG